jgi:hypothetical protein
LIVGVVAIVVAVRIIEWLGVYCIEWKVGDVGRWSGRRVECRVGGNGWDDQAV